MPVVESSYRAPLFFGNRHLQTVTPALFRKVNDVSYTRRRIDLPDGDFLDLDFSCVSASRAVIVTHGLEGSADAAYVRGMVRAFNRRGWDAIALNLRGCSGEANRKAATYHSGKTEDLDAVVEYAFDTCNYRELSLVGFSLGANLSLKYAGERGAAIRGGISSVIGISAPCDLAASARELDKPHNTVYTKRFLRSLIGKMKQLEHLMPAGITRDYDSIQTLRDFDDAFTAPLNGFADAEDYWIKNSSGRFLANTAVATLVINAKDDPILAPECFLRDLAAVSSNLYLEVPEKGGHVGFITFGNNGEYWQETRSVSFAEEHAR